MTTTHRVIIGGLVSFGVASFIFLFVFYGDPGSDQDISVEGNVAIERLIPERGTQVLQQETVGIDLGPGYVGALLIAGQVIPVEQTHGVEQLNQVLFRPGVGQVLERLPAGDVCATASYQSVSDPTDVGTIDWCFVVN